MSKQKPKLTDPTPANGPRRGVDAYDSLKSAIRDDVFPPGHHVTEQEIAVRLGMSRTPVHEALVRLQEEGLVRVIPKRGILIVPLSPEDIREVYEVIASLEATAAELLARLPEVERKNAVARLAEAAAAMEAALADDDLDRWARADDAFHRALIEGAGNTRLTRIANTVLDQSHRARMATLRLRDRPSGSGREHAAIISALSNGDAAEAARHARAHRERAGGELVPLLEKFRMRML